MLLQMALFHSFKWLSNTPWCILHHIVFIHASVSGHLGRIRVLATVNGAAVSTGVHVSSRISFFSGYMPRSGISRSQKTCFLLDVFFL